MWSTSVTCGWNVKLLCWSITETRVCCFQGKTFGKEILRQAFQRILHCGSQLLQRKQGVCEKYVNTFKICVKIFWCIYSVCVKNIVTHLKLCEKHFNAFRKCVQVETTGSLIRFGRFCIWNRQQVEKVNELWDWRCLRNRIISEWCSFLVSERKRWTDNDNSGKEISFASQLPTGWQWPAATDLQFCGPRLKLLNRVYTASTLLLQTWMEQHRDTCPTCQCLSAVPHVVSFVQHQPPFSWYHQLVVHQLETMRLPL